MELKSLSTKKAFIIRHVVAKPVLFGPSSTSLEFPLDEGIRNPLSYETIDNVSNDLIRSHVMEPVKAASGFASLIENIANAVFFYLSETLGFSRSTVSIAFFMITSCIAALLVFGYLKYGRKN